MKPIHALGLIATRLISLLLSTLLLAGLLFASLLLGPRAHAAGAPSPEEILASADRVRGGGIPGVRWDLKITAVDPDSGENVRKLEVRASGDNSVAETTYPPRASGGRLLQRGRNMWYGRPDLQKPVSISSRQKMMGPAANGDIASTNYRNDYDATLLREDEFGGERVHVLELVARSRFVTYDRIIYWVSQERLVPVKAEFYTVSGKLFKTAVFETANTLEFGGARHPFVSRMTIRDEIVPDNVSVLEYSGIRAQEFPMGTFSTASLTR